MASSPWALYNDAYELLGDDHGGLENLTLMCALATSSSNANTGTLSLLSELTNEVASGSGYTTGGAEADNVSWSETSGVATLDADDVVWTASGGTITARFAVLYFSGSVAGRTNPLLARCLLDDTPADVSATDGNTLTVAFHSSGILSIAAAS